MDLNWGKRQAKYHPYVFGAKDDVAVLVARYDMTTAELVYVAALLNRMTWRYSYGRKCFREKLANVQLPAAVVKRGGRIRLDTAVISRILPGGANGIVERITRHAGEALAAI